MKYLLFFLFVFIFSCTTKQSIFVCGDHECINKKEANQFFKDNLTIEVQIISKNKESRFNLVDLNTSGEKPDIKIFKSKNKKVVKKLSKKEIKLKKEELKNKSEKIEQINKKTEVKTNLNKQDEVTLNQNKAQKISTYKSSQNSIDICLLLKKCDIDSISNYLKKVSNEKDFPNITARE